MFSPKLLTMLVAEDDPADAFLLERAFRKAAAHTQVSFVRDGVEAVHLLENCGEKLALILLDLKMPRMDGFEVLMWLAAHPELRPGLVVIFSSSNHLQDMNRAAALGADHYLVKPSDSSELLQIVQRLEQYCFDSREDAHVGAEVGRSVGR